MVVVVWVAAVHAMVIAALIFGPRIGATTVPVMFMPLFTSHNRAEHGCDPHQQQNSFHNQIL